MRPLLVPVFLLSAAASLAFCSDVASNRAADTSRPDAVAEAAKAKAREEAVARREAERLAALWSYADVEAGKGRQVSAMISSANDVDTDGQGAKSVRLVFRDHPSWGRSSYLVLQGGDFNCYGSCTVTVTVDDAPPKPMAARRPPTDEAIAMFINDWRALWRLTGGAKRISVEFPVKAGGTRTAAFDVAGLDESKMPGFEKAATPR